MQLSSKGPLESTASSKQSAIAGSYRASSHGRETSDQIPDNNNQQLLGLIEEFNKEPSETKRPQSIAPSEPPATSHGHNQLPLPSTKGPSAMDFTNIWLM